MELKAQFRGDVRVGLLLEGQDDVHADALGPDIVRALVGRPHDPESAAGHDHVLAGIVVLGDQPAELAGLGVVTAVGHGRARPDQLLLQDQIVRILLQRLQHLFQADIGRLGIQKTGAAIDDHGRFDLLLLQNEFRLQQFELQADRAQLLAQQKILILKGQTIGRRGALLRADVLLGGLGVLVGRGENAKTAGRLGTHASPLATATHFTSTTPPRGRPATWTAARAGLCPAMKAS